MLARADARAHAGCGRVGIAALAGAFNRPAAQTQEGEPDPSDTPKPSTTVFTRPHGNTLQRLGTRLESGRGLIIEDDEEKKPVLGVETEAAREIKTTANFRAVLAIDCIKANTLEMVVAATGDSPDATRWLVRVDSKTGIEFGKQTKGVFTALAPAVRFRSQNRVSRHTGSCATIAPVECWRRGSENAPCGPNT